MCPTTCVQDALEYGLIDEVIAPNADKAEKAAAYWLKSGRAESDGRLEQWQEYLELQERYSMQDQFKKVRGAAKGQRCHGIVTVGATTEGWAMSWSVGCAEGVCSTACRSGGMGTEGTHVSQSGQPHTSSTLTICTTAPIVLLSPRGSLTTTTPPPPPHTHCPPFPPPTHTLPSPTHPHNTPPSPPPQHTRHPPLPGPCPGAAVLLP